jgi:hypothetical protein
MNLCVYSVTVKCVLLCMMTKASKRLKFNDLPHILLFSGHAQEHLQRVTTSHLPLSMFSRELFGLLPSLSCRNSRLEVSNEGARVGVDSKGCARARF